VAARRREFGIRLALGATAGNIVGLAVSSLLTCAAIGLALKNE
jgi:hypothetical protein